MIYRRIRTCERLFVRERDKLKVGSEEVEIIERQRDK